MHLESVNCGRPGVVNQYIMVQAAALPATTGPYAGFMAYQIGRTARHIQSVRISPFLNAVNLHHDNWCFIVSANNGRDVRVARFGQDFMVDYSESLTEVSSLDWILPFYAGLPVGGTATGPVTVELRSLDAGRATKQP